MTRKSVDVAVLGLGAMGAATLFQLAARGADVLGIDRFSPPHQQGSSHGETRITRLAVAEGKALAPLVRRSHEIWRDLEARTGASLFGQVGFLAISGSRPGNGAADYVTRVSAIARDEAIRHDVIDAEEARRRYPWLNLADDDRVYVEPEGGYLRPEHCVSAQLRLAAESGAGLVLDTPVREIVPQGDHVALRTDHETIRAGRAVVSAGAWASKLLGSTFEGLLRPTREILHWYGLDAAATRAWKDAPAFIWATGIRQGFYGFPAMDGAVKVAHGEKNVLVDPDQFDRSSDEAESREFYARAVEGRLNGLRPDVSRRVTCLYTVSPDGGFVIDRWPESERVLVVSPCSGHGFKHSAAIGEAVSQLVLDGASRIDLSSFRLGRFAGAGHQRAAQ